MADEHRNWANRKWLLLAMRKIRERKVQDSTKREDNPTYLYRVLQIFTGKCFDFRNGITKTVSVGITKSKPGAMTINRLTVLVIHSCFQGGI